MGFEDKKCKQLLKKNKNDFEKTLEQMFSDERKLIIIYIYIAIEMEKE